MGKEAVSGSEGEVTAWVSVDEKVIFSSTLRGDDWLFVREQIVRLGRPHVKTAIRSQSCTYPCRDWTIRVGLCRRDLGTESVIGFSEWVNANPHVWGEVI